MQKRQILCKRLGDLELEVNVLIFSYSYRTLLTVNARVSTYAHALKKYIQKYKTATCFGNEVPKHVAI
jgi:hypothetical protein